MDIRIRDVCTITNMETNYCVYFKKSEGGFHVLHNNEIKTLSYPEFMLIPRRYQCFKDKERYTADDIGLRNFDTDLQRWNAELQSDPNQKFKIDWFFYYTNGLAVRNTFTKVLNGNSTLWNKIEGMDAIDATEANYMESCFKGGITKLYVEAGIYDSYGYDFTSFYPSLLADANFEIPITKGREIYLQNITEDDIQLGYYYCRIECSNPDIKKVFAFSKNNCYTSYCLAFALKYQKKFDISITLVKDREYNAYVYDAGISGSLLFKRWYDTLLKIKQTFPSNKLIKQLLTSLWGQLTAFNKTSVSITDIDSYDLTKYTITDSDYVNSPHGYYNLQSKEKMYKHNIRIKSFLTSYGRCKVGEVAMRNLSQLISIQTDGIVFTHPQDMSDVPSLRPDSKTTGQFRWENAKKKERVD